MSTTVTLHTTDAATVEVVLEAGQSVLDASAAAGHLLPSQCGQGTCGSCHAVARGDYRLAAHDQDALGAEAQARGGVLLCCTYPTGDTLDVDLPYPQSRIVEGGVGRRTARVSEAIEVGAGMVWLRLSVDPDDVNGSGVDFEPGQFAELELPGEEHRRAYSMANTPNWDGSLEFLIRLREGGWFSGFLRDVLDGVVSAHAPVVVNGPLGAFGLRETGLRPRIFVAGGTGLAPIMSLLRRMAEFGDPQPVRLILGVNEEADLPHLPPLDEAIAGLQEAVVEPCVHTPGPDWTGRSGTPVDAVREAVAEILATGTAPDVYVSGPPALVDAVTSAGVDAGLASQHIIAERVLPT